MKAGPEMNRAVLEKVFGYEWGKIGDRDQAYMPHGYSCSGPDVFCNNKSWVDLPNFSGDISAAWEVVGKLKAAYRDGSDMASFSVQYNQGFWVCFLGPTPTDNIESIIAETAPEAICRAALKAVGHLESEEK